MPNAEPIETKTTKRIGATQLSAGCSTTSLITDFPVTVSNHPGRAGLHFLPLLSATTGARGFGRSVAASTTAPMPSCDPLKMHSSNGICQFSFFRQVASDRSLGGIFNIGQRDCSNWSSSVFGATSARSLNDSTSLPEQESHKSSHWQLQTHFFRRRCDGCPTASIRENSTEESTLKTIRMIAIGIGLMALGAGQAYAGLLGASIEGQYYYPNLSSPDGAPLGPVVVNPTASFDFSIAGDITFTFSDTTMKTVFAAGSASGATFNGAVFTVESGGSPITGVTIDPATTVLNFDLSRVSFTGTTISENVEGLTFGDRTITLDLQFGSSAVPEPSTLITAAVAVVVGLGALAKEASPLSRS